MFLCFNIICSVSNILFNSSKSIKLEENYQSTNEIIEEYNLENNVSNQTMEEGNTANNVNNEVSNVEINSYEWKLEIPSIDLKADIEEGTNKKTLDEYIGHFEETKKNLGNIGLAAHNRGYKVNYFEKLKYLKEGDLIYYTYKETKRAYVVISKTIIKDTEWSNLENTKDNRLTLITCVENKPELRRCVQAIELKK